LTDGEKQKKPKKTKKNKKKTSAKHIRIRLLPEGGCVNNNSSVQQNKKLPVCKTVGLCAFEYFEFYIFLVVY